MIVLKCVSRAARNRSRKAPSTATIAKSSGITVGTSARNSTIRITNAASSPMRSLMPCVGGAFSASPVNSTWMPGGLADRAQLILDRDDVRARQLEARSVVLHVEEGDLRRCRRAASRSGGQRARDRPRRPSCSPPSERCEACDATSILRDRRPNARACRAAHRRAPRARRAARRPSGRRTSR